MTPVLPAGAAAPRAPAPVPPRSFGALLEQHRRVLLAEPPPAPAPALQLLASVDRARARLDGVLAAARSGRTFTAQELLGLQAEAYRTIQTVDLAVKAAEQGAQSVRQALATQV